MESSVSANIFTIQFVLGLAQATLVGLRERGGVIEVMCRVTNQAIVVLGAQTFCETAALLVALGTSLPSGHYGVSGYL